MPLPDISITRLLNQKVVNTAFTKAEEIVGWMGAMQAQDYNMAKWAVGSRLINASDKKIETAYNKGAILRTHVMRPTWHFVTAGDIYWMLNLTAPKIRASLKTRQRWLELTETTIVKSNAIIEKALSKGKNLTREELTKDMNDAGIRTDENRLSHLLLCAELDKIVCSGPVKERKLTYALLSERVPDKVVLTRDESLVELAKRYFTSHGPATIKDFTWWSGLAVAEARQALDFAQSALLSETIGNERYWFADSLPKTTADKTTVHLLPAFDEFLISYKDRSASLSLTHNKKAVSDNGIFRPVIVVNGQVAGIWKPIKDKDKVDIETTFFTKINKSAVSLLRNKLDDYGTYLNKSTEIKNVINML